MRYLYQTPHGFGSGLQQCKTQCSDKHLLDKFMEERRNIGKKMQSKTLKMQEVSIFLDFFSEDTHFNSN